MWKNHIPCDELLDIMLFEINKIRSGIKISAEYFSLLGIIYGDDLFLDQKSESVIKKNASDYYISFFKETKFCNHMELYEKIKDMIAIEIDIGKYVANYLKIVDPIFNSIMADKKDFFHDILRIALTDGIMPDGLITLFHRFRDNIDDNILINLISKDWDLTFSGPNIASDVEKICSLYEKYEALTDACGIKKQLDSFFKNKLSTIDSMIIDLARHCIMQNCEAARIKKIVDLIDKSRIAKYCEQGLSNRLIRNSTNIEDEINILNKFKLICGAEHVKKMDRIIYDAIDSKRVSDLLNAELRNVKSSFLFMSSGYWQIPCKKEFLILPEELEKCLFNFEDHYLKTHSDRKISRINSLSSAEITTRCFKKIYRITCSLLQLSILLLFDKEQQYSVQEICNSTNIDMKYLVRIISFFIKTKLLIRDNDGEVDIFLPNDVIRLNSKFNKYYFFSRAIFYSLYLFF